MPVRAKVKVGSVKAESDYIEHTVTFIAQVGDLRLATQNGLASVLPELQERLYALMGWLEPIPGGVRHVMFLDKWFLAESIEQPEPPPTAVLMLRKRGLIKRLDPRLRASEIAEGTVGPEKMHIERLLEEVPPILQDLLGAGTKVLKVKFKREVIRRETGEYDLTPEPSPSLQAVESA